MNRTLGPPVLALVAATAVGVAAFAALGSTAAATSARNVDGSLADIRAATAKYHNVDVALAHGYVPSSPCEEQEAGGMGVHYVNYGLLAQPIQLTKPAILLYVPTAHGPRLVGVEYLTPDADQDLGTDADRPSLLGVPFDGPMPGHTDEMPVHYDLHVWVWKNNPSGMFAAWNPKVSCPS